MRSKVKLIIVLVEEGEEGGPPPGVLEGVEGFLTQNQIASVVIGGSRNEVDYEAMIQEIKLKNGIQLVPRELQVSEPILAVGVSSKAENGPFAITSVTLPSRQYYQPPNTFTCWFDPSLPQGFTSLLELLSSRLMKLLSTF